jgi:hypothetical protein
LVELDFIVGLLVVGRYFAHVAIMPQEIQQGGAQGASSSTIRIFMAKQVNSFSNGKV